ncbi:MAG: histidine-type phosphatase, partial [Rhodospirillales bacterium]|nr:histidine-type phosphatase [Rhodospirillales bacterium]
MTILANCVLSHAEGRARQTRSDERCAKRFGVHVALFEGTRRVATTSGRRPLPTTFALRAVRAALFVLASVITLPALAALPPPPPDATLKAVVLLSRHGMRGPTDAIRCSGPEDSHCLDAVAHDPWPDLDVSAGHLTAPGYDRVVTMGRFYRALYAEAGLFPAQGCPAPGSVAFRTDAVERTTMTAGAISDGMFPGCDPAPLVITPRLYDGPACGFDKAQAEKASQALAGGS